MGHWVFVYKHVYMSTMIVGEIVMVLSSDLNFDVCGDFCGCTGPAFLFKQYKDMQYYSIRSQYYSIIYVVKAGRWILWELLKGFGNF